MPTKNPNRTRPKVLSCRGSDEDIAEIRRRYKALGVNRGEQPTLEQYVLQAALGAKVVIGRRQTAVEKETPRQALLFDLRQLAVSIDRLRGEISKQGGLLKSLYVRDSETLALADRDSEQLAEIAAYNRAQAEAARMLADNLAAYRAAVIDELSKG